MAYTREYYSVLKRKGILVLATTQTILRDIMEKASIVYFNLSEVPSTVKLTRKKNIDVFSGG